MFQKKGVGTLRRQISLDYITTALPPNLTRLLDNTASYAGYAKCTIYCNFKSLHTIHMNIQWDMEGWKWSLSTGVDSATFTWLYWRQCTASCLGGWEGGSLTAPSDVIRQMHTIGRMVVKYTRLGMVGVLLFWKYCCFICGSGKREKLHVSPGALVYFQISLSRKLKKTKAALINTSSTRCLQKIASKPRARANVLRTNILWACRFGHDACSTELRKSWPPTEMLLYKCTQ